MLFACALLLLPAELEATVLLLAHPDPESCRRGYTHETAAPRLDRLVFKSLSKQMLAGRIRLVVSGAPPGTGGAGGRGRTVCRLGAHCLRLAMSVPGLDPSPVFACRRCPAGQPPGGVHARLLLLRFPPGTVDSVALWDRQTALTGARFLLHLPPASALRSVRAMGSARPVQPPS